MDCFVDDRFGTPRARAAGTGSHSAGFSGLAALSTMDETSYVLSGRLGLTRGASEEELEEQEIKPGQAWRVEPGTVHSMRP